MGSHRADRSGSRRRPSGTPTSHSSSHSSQSGESPAVDGPSTYVGRRVARPVEPVAQAELRTQVLASVAVEAAAATTAELPVVVVRRAPGSRKAVKHAGSRGSLYKGLPSVPVLVGVATLAVAVGGALTSTGPDLAASADTGVRQASALSGASGTGSVFLGDREQQVSRDSRRDALADTADNELVAAAEQQAKQRNAALAQFAKQAEARAGEIALNRWVMPLDNISLTARYGEYGLWSSYHTGLDFNGETGDPIYAVANGVITSTGSDGAYGNKTVLTLEDGTEIWFCHQTDIFVSDGDVVRAGETIGTVGTTGHVTGSHLHIEVRPGGGDPVDPYQAFLVHGATF
ncbi:M23 family metallopeptidase [Nocardioides sp. cx-173]|uniref:M23 family metallopeptidase n=1 Tax=Nocardioides sp. cx-173 TaxID=2898796 RepID=UPI001E5EC12C|nr:M23 family metallopeptidase [Nocardioides sp. cx-173]MCD4524597.1 M23 family metallopeptidase [Nocardioides sp. cx-173]UGB42920.1 M23 family metallopeptidase [Nocardioides sp. cx-173]